jgi:hypothetical protein
LVTDAWRFGKNKRSAESSSTSACFDHPDRREDAL